MQRAIIALLIGLFLYVPHVEADTFKKGAPWSGPCNKHDKFGGGCAGGGALSNVTSTDFNTSSFNGRIEGPTDTAVHTSAPIGDFSGCLWFEVDSAMVRFQGPAGSATSFALSNGYGIYRGTSDTVVEFYVGAFGSSASFDYTPTNIWGAADGWHHLCYAHDATNRQYTVWHNAIQMQSGINASPVSRPLGDTNDYGEVGTGGTSGAHFEGKVDEPVFWQGTIISQANVDDLYNSGAPVDPTGVVSGATWWLRMGDDGSDNDTVITGQVTDQTANGNNFTPEGSQTNVGFVADVP